MDDSKDPNVKKILHRLRAPEDNPVRRARRVVEAQVPPHRRGPGWDRHWRELEAYLDEPGCWAGKAETQDDR
ncbi:hypothetical protein [Sphingobium cloacae]|uniref:hypothetical protein n=1 Tax=Sphingobium cloacae TaxID=120107 RepID=UPI0008318A62|nr:hypothetical protein [Sphingobium cloacae]